LTFGNDYTIPQKAVTSRWREIIYRAAAVGEVPSRELVSEGVTKGRRQTVSLKEKQDTSGSIPEGRKPDVL
jgi:hypothetical protein